ncbi:protein kinase-like domain, concanavalin A-like lectin/glucanase domain protein [Tanacetum coccineum]
MKCLCNMWQLSGIPCVHAMVGYMHMKMNSDLGVDEWYSQSKCPLVPKKEADLPKVVLLAAEVVLGVVLAAEMVLGVVLRVVQAKEVDFKQKRLGNIIDSSLSEVVLGKPFEQASKLAYDESLGLIRFAHSDDEVVFRMPQRTKELDLVSPLEKDKFEAFIVESLKVFMRRWELTGMPCKHVVEAIINMAVHGKEVGIPEDWVAQCRPRKKRRMTKDDIVEHDLKKMVKRGKMSKMGTVMTCGKCRGKGHNRRGCTGLRDIIFKGKRVMDQERKEYQMR